MDPLTQISRQSLSQNPEYLSKLDDDGKNDEELVLHALAQLKNPCHYDKACIWFASEELQADEGFIEEAIKVSGRFTLNEVDTVNHLDNKELLMLGMETVMIAKTHLEVPLSLYDKMLKDEDICRTIITVMSMGRLHLICKGEEYGVLEHIPEHYQIKYKALLLHAFLHAPRIINFLCHELKNDPAFLNVGINYLKDLTTLNNLDMFDDLLVLRQFISMQPDQYTNLPEKYRTKDILFYALCSKFTSPLQKRNFTGNNGLDSMEIDKVKLFSTIEHAVLISDEAELVKILSGDRIDLEKAAAFFNKKRPHDKDVVSNKEQKTDE